MDETQRAAFLISQSAEAMIRALGMFSENLQRLHSGNSMAYTESDFDDLIRQSGIGYNDALSLLQGR